MADNIVEFPGGPGGRLEQIEILCLNYLRQAKDPVIAVSTLFDHCERAMEHLPLTRAAFTEFLRNHGEITYFEGMGQDAPLQKELFAAAGVDLGPRVILKERTPTPVEMVQMMAAQLRDLLKALELVRERAEQAGDTARMEAIDKARERAEKMQEALKYLG
jgi:predicted Rossmann-fold nucleotide-binding protein